RIVPIFNASTIRGRVSAIAAMKRSLPARRLSGTCGFLDILSRSPQVQKSPLPHGAEGEGKLTPQGPCRSVSAQEQRIRGGIREKDRRRRIGEAAPEPIDSAAGPLPVSGREAAREGRRLRATQKAS